MNNINGLDFEYRLYRLVDSGENNPNHPSADYYVDKHLNAVSWPLDLCLFRKIVLKSTKSMSDFSLLDTII